MTDIIDNLFHGNLDPSLLDLKKGSDYNKKRHEILSIIDTIKDAGKEKEATKLSDAIGDLDCIISRAYFTIGFRWGARMALAILNDEHDTFSL